MEHRTRGRRIISGKVAGRAGIFSAVLFGVLILGQGMLYPEYSQVRQMISVLATFNTGWIQNANFIITGVALLVFSIGLAVAPLRGFGSIIGPLLLAVSASGLILAGFFPMDKIAGVAVDTPVHTVGALMAFAGAGAGLFFSSLAFSRTAGFREAAMRVRLAGLAVAGLFLVFAHYAKPEDAPLHLYAGLLQRVIILIWIIAIVSVSQCLIRPPESAGGKT
jgi:hypothetical membrane protein